MSTSGNGGGSLQTNNGYAGCPICKGRGWVGRRVPVGHPEFGEVFPCRCQQADGEKNRKSALREYSNLGSLARISFEETAPTGVFTDPESQRRFTKALARAEDYAENAEGWLALTGPSGCGKTHLAAAIANSLIERGQTVLFVFVPDLLDHLRGAYSPDSPISYDDLFQQVKDAPVLVMDDLGAQSGTPWAREKLLQIFNHRFNERMPTVVTIRGPLERLEEGIRSRLQNPALSGRRVRGPARRAASSGSRGTPRSNAGGDDPGLLQAGTGRARDRPGKGDVKVRLRKGSGLCRVAQRVAASHWTARMRQDPPNCWNHQREAQSGASRPFLPSFRPCWTTCGPPSAPTA